MTRLRVFLSRLSGLVRKGSLERDLDEELTLHVQMEIEENLRRGMTAAAARSAALRRFAGMAQVKEARRETHSLPAVQVLWQDVRVGMLYQVSPRDPMAFGSAFLVMAAASLAACFLPAWRATRTDPVRALRD